jgi:hypothetical protein
MIVLVLSGMNIVRAILACIFFIPNYYSYAGFSSLVFGIVMAGYGWFKGCPPILFALAVAIGLFVIKGHQAQDGSFTTLTKPLFFACIVAASVCWFAFNKLWHKVT